MFHFVGTYGQVLWNDSMCAHNCTDYRCGGSLLHL